MKPQHENIHKKKFKKALMIEICEKLEKVET